LNYDGNTYTGYDLTNFNEGHADVITTNDSDVFTITSNSADPSQSVFIDLSPNDTGAVASDVALLAA